MPSAGSLWWLLLVVYLCADVLLTTTFLGFYQSGFRFSSTLIYDKLFLAGGYHFYGSALEFVVLAVFRALILIAGIFASLFVANVPNLTLFFTGLSICNASFSLIKILAFSEEAEQLAFAGVWLNMIWNCLSFVALHALWHFVICANRLSLAEFSHQSLSSQSSDDAEPLVNNNESTEEPKEETRMSTLSHVLRLLTYCKYHSKWFLAGFIFLCIYSGARVFIPYYTGQVIANMVKGDDRGVFLQSVFIMSVLTIVSTIFGGLRGGCFDYATALVNRRMRRDLFNSIMSQEIAFFDSSQTGEIVSRLTADCQTMSSTVSTNLNVFMRNSVMLVGSVIFMINLSWRLTLVTLVAVPPIAFFSKIYGAYYDRLSERTQETIAQANRMAEEVIGSVRTVRSFACEQKECERFDKHLGNTLKVNQKKSVAYMGFTWVNELSNNIILIAVLFYGGHLVLTSKMTSSQIISFLLYQMQLGENFYNLNYVFTGLMESVGASRKVFEYMHRQPKISNDGALMLSVKGKIAFTDVSFTYPTRPNVAVLEKLSFEIQPGETIALVGPSGAGKSSIISLIEHFYEAVKGQVTLDNVSIEQFDHVYYHQQIALVAQEPVLYADSVRYNILYGCEDWATEEDMIAAAKLANVHDFIMEMEKGYDTKCGEKGVQMSGGQKQRIAIARALIRRPKVLILDEATSALDSESEHIIQEALQKCAVGRTVIIIAHRLSTVEKADRIIVINKGCLMEVGSHAELMNSSDGLYRSLVKRQLLNANPNGESDESKC